MALVLCSFAPGDAAAAEAGDWRMYGRDAAGTRSNKGETTLSPSSVRTLHVAWKFATRGGPVYGTPAVVGDTVYTADLAGNVYALAATTGRIRWLSHIPRVSVPFPLQVTDSPLVTRRYVIVGDQSGSVHALDRRTGLPRWSVRPNNFGGYPAIWGSAVAITARTATGGHRRLILVPVSSNEETFTPSARQPCCKARGSIAALDPDTGRVVWQYFTITPADATRGAAGATVWTSPSFSRSLNLVYIATGNNFGNKERTPTTTTSDALIALDAATGRVRWLNQRTVNDTWTGVYHPNPAHPDSDFGDSPDVYKLANGRTVVAAGQKSGFMHVLDAATGETLALKQFLPSGGYGGLFADSAQAGGTIFANGNDWPDFGGGEFGAVLGSFFGGSDPKSGDLIAIRADQEGQLDERWRLVTPGSPMMSGVAVANGVVYAASSRQGFLYAVNAATGATLARVSVGPTVAGPSVAHGRVFIGYGDVVNIGGLNPTKGGVIALAR